MDLTGLTGNNHRIEVEHWVCHGHLTPITAKKGDVIVITLSENSSTGYLWEHLATNLELINSVSTEPDANTVGSSNIRTMTFKVNGPDELILSYQRPWETIRANKRLTLQVNVV